MYPNFGIHKNNFPFGTNRNLLSLGVPKLKHIAVVQELCLTVYQHHGILLEF